jgi:hypothetical protein
LEKLWIRQGKPSKVIESSEVHYFYWLVELGVGSLKISRLKVPTFPIKFLDYEPVKVVKVGNAVQIMSRFHYRILLYFNRPSVVSKRAIVDFSFGSHSPFVHSDGNKFGSTIDFEGMDSREIDAYNFLMFLYGGIMSGKLKARITQIDLRDYQLIKEKVPENVVLDIKKIKGIIWVGDFPQGSTVPREVGNFLFPQTPPVESAPARSP